MKYEYFDSPIHGYGSRATEDISKNEIVAKEPFINLDNDRNKNICVKNYYWSRTKLKTKTEILILGLGCMANHSFNPNINLRLSECKKYVIFYALKDISKDEELFLNYGRVWWRKKGIKPL
tara:strand:+ start:88 stop:450 length:363 start_codon:yes stop_codon:yes gene_type:complete